MRSTRFRGVVPGCLSTSARRRCEPGSATAAIAVVDVGNGAGTAPLLRPGATVLVRVDPGSYLRLCASRIACSRGDPRRGGPADRVDAVRPADANAAAEPTPIASTTGPAAPSPSPTRPATPTPSAPPSTPPPPPSTTTPVTTTPVPTPFTTRAPPARRARPAPRRRRRHPAGIRHRPLLPPQRRRLRPSRPVQTHERAGPDGSGCGVGRALPGPPPHRLRHRAAPVGPRSASTARSSLTSHGRRVRDDDGPLTRAQAAADLAVGGSRLRQGRHRRRAR